MPAGGNALAMRSPVPRNRLVALSILAALLTGAITAYPALLPGADTMESPAAGDPGVGLAAAGDAGPTSPTATAGTAGAGASTPSAGAPTAAPAVPTPNPDFTPAVETATPSGHEGEHEHEAGGWDDD